MRTIRFAGLVLLLCSATARADLWTGSTLDGLVCRGTPAIHGPFDYYAINDPTDALYQEGRLWEIDDIHYGKGVRHAEKSPLTQFEYQLAAGEFDYTLRAIPNHPEALVSVVRLELRKRREEKQNGIVLSSSLPRPECYFQRAILFQPNAAYLPMLYGNYLHLIGEPSLAVGQYTKAIELDPDNAEIHYNIGLSYLELGDIANASVHADKAYSAGFPLPGLRNKLARAAEN